MVRHFAYFNQTTGEYIEERMIDVNLPLLPSGLSKEVRTRLLDLWATYVAQPGHNEIALDVTQFGYPLGDFCWMVFDPIDRMLDWPIYHTFIEIDKGAGEIFACVKSVRPIRSTDKILVIDITDMPPAQFFGVIAGYTYATKQIEAAIINNDFPIVDVVPERVEVYANR